MNNKMVPMAVLDLIWMGISSAALLALLAIMGFILFKVGIISFKIAMDVVGAAKEIETIDGVIKQPNHRIAAEKNETEIILSFVKAEIEKNQYASYAYNLFKVEIIISYINSSIIPKIEEINEKYESLFENKKIRSYANSLKNFMESKGKKNFAKYAYIQLFKK